MASKAWTVTDDATIKRGDSSGSKFPNSAPRSRTAADRRPARRSVCGHRHRQSQRRKEPPKRPRPLRKPPPIRLHPARQGVGGETVWATLQQLLNGINTRRTAEASASRCRREEFRSLLSAPLNGLDPVTIDSQLNELGLGEAGRHSSYPLNGNIGLIGQKPSLTGEKVKEPDFPFRFYNSHQTVRRQCPSRSKSAICESAGSRKLLTEGGAGTEHEELIKGVTAGRSVPPIAAQKILQPFAMHQLHEGTAEASASKLSA